MQIKPADIGSHLASGMAPLYLVSGEETLIVEETCDAIIRAAREHGFSERSVHHVDGNFSWSNLHHDGASMSLFAERKILDVRVPGKKIDKEGSAALRDWVEHNEGSDPDSLLLVRSGQLDANQRKSAWYKAIDQAGVIVTVWPMDASELPRWLTQRLKLRDLKADPDALAFLAERVEGNLLAAVQEIDKLALQGMEQPMSLNGVIACLEDTARYSTFDLLDAVMDQKPERVRRILEVFREEKTGVFPIVFAFANQLRRAHNPRGLPRQTQQRLSKFVGRIRDIRPVLAECAVIDQQAKGQMNGDAWVSLERLLLRLAGLRQLSLPSQDMRRLG